MDKSFILLLSLCWSLGIAQGQETFPAVRLLPEDFVQDSIKEVHWTTNTFAIKWKYTATGAEKMLAFWEQHKGQKVCIRVGNFQTPPFAAPGLENPITHADLKKSWLERPTDKFMNLGENDARAIIAGMKGG